MKTFCAAIEEYVVEPRSMKFHGRVISPGTKEHRKMRKQIRRHILAGRKPVLFRGRINRRGRKALRTGWWDKDGVLIIRGSKRK